MVSTTSRRSFLKRGAFVAAPLVAVAAPAAALADDGSAARLARIEDERAIEAAQREFLRTNGPKALRGKAKRGETVRRIDPEAEPPAIDFADDGKRATTRQKCTVQLASDFSGDTTLEQMARLQGTSRSERSKRCVVLAHYQKQGTDWALLSAEFA